MMRFEIGLLAIVYNRTYDLRCIIFMFWGILYSSLLVNSCHKFSKVGTDEYHNKIKCIILYTMLQTKNIKTMRIKVELLKF